MANIRVELTEPLLDGMDVKFRTPCDCSEVTGLTVVAPTNAGGVASRVFTFKDAHGSDISNLGNLFAEGVLVKVMVDTQNNSAYILNADTNSYLEDAMASAGPMIVTITRGTNTTWKTDTSSDEIKAAISAGEPPFVFIPAHGVMCAYAGGNSSELYFQALRFVGGGITSSASIYQVVISSTTALVYKCGLSTTFEVVSP